MISTAAASKQKLPTSLQQRLPIPCTYEELYSSYQNEWDLRRKKADGTDACVRLDLSDNVDIDQNVSGLEWVTLPAADDRGKSETFLMACTGSGEILAWKLKSSSEDSINSTIGSNILPIDKDGHTETNIGDSTNNTLDSTVGMLLEPHARMNVCNSDDETLGDDSDKEEDGDNLESLHGLSIVVVNVQDDSKYRGAKRQIRKRPRQKKSSSSNNNDEEKREHLLLVAGEGGLWSIPLREVLRQPWTPSSSGAAPSTSLLQLSDRPILQLRSSNQEKTQSLFALEKDTNVVSIWNLSAILKRHSSDSNSEEGGPVPYETIDLFRCFSGVAARVSSGKPTKRRRIASKRERATTILVVSGLADGDGSSGRANGSTLLVGTDRSRLWTIPFPNGERNVENLSGDDPKNSKPRCFSLNDERISPSGTAEPSYRPMSRHGGSSSNNNNSRRVGAPITWKVTDILETNGGTWWTVSATADGHTHTMADPTSGLLLTWHAPSGMVVARMETREAIRAIGHRKQGLYSVANEQALTAWESCFRLNRRARLWTSAPSGRVVSISESPSFTAGISQPILAVAGVGNQVDLFVDDCRVQTVRI